MKITKSQLRQIIREEVSNLDFPDTQSEKLHSDGERFKQAADAYVQQVEDSQEKQKIKELLLIIASMIHALSFPINPETGTRGSIRYGHREGKYIDALAALDGFRSVMDDYSKRTEELKKYYRSRGSRLRGDDDSKSTEDK